MLGHIHIHSIFSHPTAHIHIHYIFTYTTHSHILYRYVGPYSHTLHILPTYIHLHFTFTYTTYSHTLHTGVLGRARDHLFNLGCQKFQYSQTQSFLSLTFYIPVYSAELDTISSTEGVKHSYMVCHSLPYDIHYFSHSTYRCTRRNSTPSLRCCPGALPVGVGVCV